MRPALLYHHMDVSKALSVLTSDAMPGRFKHHDPVSGRHLHGNSFSRNPSMGVRPTDCVRLVVDPTSLRTRHRVVPFDSDAAFERYRRFIDDAGNVNWDEHDDYWNAYDLDQGERDRIKNAYHLQWAEEFVVGDIRDLHRHVVSVEVNHLPHPRWTTLRSAASMFGKRHGIPVEIAEEEARRAIPQGTDVGAMRTLRPIPILTPIQPLDIPYEPMTPDGMGR